MPVCLQANLKMSRSLLIVFGGRTADAAVATGKMVLDRAKDVY